MKIQEAVSILNKYLYIVNTIGYKEYQLIGLSNQLPFYGCFYVKEEDIISFAIDVIENVNLKKVFNNFIYKEDILCRTF